jgi:predicted Zn-dependent protease
MTTLKPWTLEQLKTELRSKKEIKGWIVTQENLHRRERYFLLDGGKLAVDQDREVHSQSVEVRLFVTAGKPGRQGEISKKFVKEKPIAVQLESAIAAAKETDYEAWDLPTELPKDVPEVKSCDPKMAEDLQGSIDSVTREIASAVTLPRKTAFNSSELFMSVHDKELHLSNGLTHRSKQSRMYVEAAYSFAKDGRSDEYLHTAWTISPKDISVTHLFQEASDRAEISLDTKKPLTGKYAVILDADVLAKLFNSTAFLLSARSEYLDLPHKKPGDDFISGATGDLVTITLDPSLDYGAVTTGMGDQGIVQKPLVLVEKNKVVTTAIDQQHGQYLKKKPGTYRGNMVLEGGALDRDQMIQAAPKVLEILQFSGLFIQETTGTFSSEIRLARLHDHTTGLVTTIKGGSLSGSIGDNFKFARFSKNRVKRSEFDYGVATGYYGPEFALLSDVSVVG